MAFRSAIRSINAEIALCACLISIILTLLLVYSLGIFATSNVREQIGLKLSGLAHHDSDKLDQAMLRDKVMTTGVTKKGIEAFILAQDGTVLLGPRDMTGVKLGLASFAHAQQAENNFLIETWSDGKDYLVGFSPTAGYQTCPGLGWTVLVRQPVGETFAPVGRMQRDVSVTGLGVAFVFSLFGLFNARRIARPLTSLAHKARQIRVGESKTIGDVPPSYAEINELTAAIGSLVGQLQKESAALQELNTPLEQRVETRTAQLTQSEEQLRTITDSIPALIAYVDA